MCVCVRREVVYSHTHTHTYTTNTNTHTHTCTPSLTLAKVESMASIVKSATRRALAGREGGVGGSGSGVWGEGAAAYRFSTTWEGVSA